MIDDDDDSDTEMIERFKTAKLEAQVKYLATITPGMDMGINEELGTNVSASAIFSRMK